MIHGPIEIIGVAAFAVLTVFWPIYFYRKAISTGIVFTPMLICLLLFLPQVAPSMLLAHYYGFHPNPYPSIVFILAFLFLWVGYLLPGKHRITAPHSTQNMFYRFLTSRPNTQETLARLALIGVLVLLGLNYFDGLPPAYHSLVATLQGNVGELTKELQQSRLALTKGAYFGGESKGQGINTATQEIGWALLIAHASAVLALRGGVKAGLWLFAMIIGAWLFVAGTGTRGPFVLCCIAGLVAYSLVRPIPPRYALIVFLVLIGVLVFLTSYSHRFQDVIEGDAAWTDAFVRVFERLVYGNGSNDVRAILASDQGLFYEGFAHFHIRNFISAIPGVQGGLPLAYRITEIYGGGSTTFSTGTYISTVYVDFGLIGIVVVFLFMGVALRLFQTSLFPAMPHPWLIAALATFTQLSGKIIINGFTNFMSYMVVFFVLLGLHLFFMIVLQMLPRTRRQRSVPYLPPS